MKPGPIGGRPSMETAEHVLHDCEALTCCLLCTIGYPRSKFRDFLRWMFEGGKTAADMRDEGWLPLRGNWKSKFKKGLTRFENLEGV